MLVTVAALFAGLLMGQAGAQLSPCALGCVDGVFMTSDKLGCAPGDSLCMCGRAPDLQNGIRDCIIQACPAEGTEQVTFAADNGVSRCVAASSAAGLVPVTTATSIPTSVPSPEPTTPTSQPSPSAAETSAASTRQETTTPETTPTSTPSRTPSSSLQTSRTSTPSTSSATRTPSSAENESPTPTRSANPSSTSAASEDEEDPSESRYSDELFDDETGGMSVALKAGIGAGVGAAGLFTFIILVCVLMRRRQRKKEDRHRTLQISEPLPGSGRYDEHKNGPPLPAIYSPTSPTSRGSYSSELDRRARPYEEMQPRTQPRILI